MVTISPITQQNISGQKPRLLKQAVKLTENFINESKSENFNIREYAKKGLYELVSAKLEGTILGEKNTSLKLLIHNYRKKSIFAILKNGKVLGARGYLADKLSIDAILNKLCQKGKIKEEELKYVKDQLEFV